MNLLTKNTSLLLLTVLTGFSHGFITNKNGGVVPFLSRHDVVVPVGPSTSPNAKQQRSQQNEQQYLLPQMQSFNRYYRRPVVLYMGWGPDPIWSTAKVTAKEVACKSESCVSVTLDIPPETAQEYAIPGQYVQLRANEDTKPLFLAISSPPDPENASFEFLIKKTEGNEWITSADVTSGMSVEISQVLGKGFPMEENFEGFKYDFPTQNILLFAAGSGIAPIKAAMESGQLQLGTPGGGGRTARLYYGVSHPDDLCFVGKFADWEGMGIQVVPVISQPSPDWGGRTGYVQIALEEDGVPIPRNSGALLCGMKGMTEAVKDILVKAGVFDGRILTNF